WGGRFPTAADLDRVTPDHPVRLSAKSGHAAWVNSRALALAGVTAATPDPAGGALVRDARGQPTGVLLEEAMRLVDAHIPPPNLEGVLAGMRAALAVVARAGLTSLHDMDGPLAFQAEQILRERDELTVRIVKSIPLAHLDEAIGLGLRTGLGDDWLRIGQVKMFADGALGPRTAWMLEGYASAPEDTGIATTPVEVLRASVRRANAAGLGCAIHAIGDRACREVLDLYADARGAHPGPRNRIEHAQILHPDDTPRFGALGVIASMQPIHCTSDMHISDRHLGPRAAGAYAFRTLLATGATLAFGSDAPVEPVQPLIGIHAAVTRRRADGSPGWAGWHPEHRLSVSEALRGYTLGAAHAAGLEDRLGALAPGKLADVTILDGDLFEVASTDILTLQVLGTLVGGRWAWRDSAL
ncbi:MAG: amidohydrolase, partial [Chloroflexota bacterium]